MFCWGGHPARQIAILRLHANNVQIGNLAVFRKRTEFDGWRRWFVPSARLLLSFRFRARQGLQLSG